MIMMHFNTGTARVWEHVPLGLAVRVIRPFAGYRFSDDPGDSRPPGEAIARPHGQRCVHSTSPVPGGGYRAPRGNGRRWSCGYVPGEFFLRFLKTAAGRAIS